MTNCCARCYTICQTRLPCGALFLKADSLNRKQHPGLKCVQIDSHLINLQRWQHKAIVMVAEVDGLRSATDHDAIHFQNSCSGVAFESKLIAAVAVLREKSALISAPVMMPKNSAWLTSSVRSLGAALRWLPGDRGWIWQSQ